MPALLSTEPVSDPNPVTRNPLVVIGAVVAVIQFIVTQWGEVSLLLLSLGLTPETVTLVQSILTVILTLAGVLIGRAYVTPLSDPKNAEGEKLTV